VQELTEVPRCPTPPALDGVTPNVLLRRLRSLLARVGEQVAELRPQGELVAGRLRPEHYRFFAVQEQSDRLRQLCENLVEQMEAARDQRRLRTALPPGKLSHPRRTLKSAQRFFHWDAPMGKFLREISMADSAQAYLQPQMSRPPLESSEAQEQLEELRQQAALLEQIAQPGDPGGEQVVLWVRPLHDAGQPWAEKLADLYQQTLGPKLGLEASRDSRETAVLVQGPHARALAELEEGTHLFYPQHAAVLPLQVLLLRLTDEQSMQAAVAAARQRRRDWQQRLAAGQAAVVDDPFALQPVVRIYQEGAVTVDLRTGQMVSGPLKAEILEHLLVSALPVPAELQGQESER
jgi:hypothetical protein